MSNGENQSGERVREGEGEGEGGEGEMTVRGRPYLSVLGLQA